MQVHESLFLATIHLSDKILSEKELKFSQSFSPSDSSDLWTPELRESLQAQVILLFYFKTKRSEFSESGSGSRPLVRMNENSTDVNFAKKFHFLFFNSVLIIFTCRHSKTFKIK